MTTYAYRHGVGSAAVPAEKAYGELERIRAANDDRLNPRDVVDESRPEQAVLHAFFDWNDTTAAEEYRVQQARRLTRSVYVVTPKSEEQPGREIPAYYHIESNNYQPTERVIAQDDLYTAAFQALQLKFSQAERALRELEQAARDGGNPDRMAAIGLAVQGFEAVRSALALIH